MPIQDNSIQKIIDQIIIAANLGGLPEAEEQAFRENMEAQITRRLGLIIMDNLDDKGLKEYEKLIKDNPIPDQDDFQKFLNDYLPNSEEIIREGMEIFMKEIIVAFNK
jgi:hypothetical protein